MPSSASEPANRGGSPTASASRSRAWTSSRRRSISCLPMTPRAIEARMSADLVVQGPDIDTPALKALARLAGGTEIVALDRAATQAFRIAGEQRRDAIAAFCLEAGFDFAFVPRDRDLARVRVVAFDMDSTLIANECID